LLYAGAMNNMGRVTRRHGGFMSNLGFTMLELLSTLAVMGVLSAAAIPLLAGMFGATSNQAVAEQLLRILARARQLAITRNTDVCVVLNDNSITYRMGGCNGSVFVSADTDGTGNIRLNNATPVTAASSVVFSGLGAANPSGSTYVVHNSTGGTGVTVVVPATGRARIQ